MSRRKREFRCKYFDVEEDYFKIHSKHYDFLGGINPKFASKAIPELMVLIDKEPNFFDPYLDIYYYLKDYFDLPISSLILNSAYELATKLIVDRKGNWPDEMIFEAANNRHIIRVIIAKGELEWEKGKIIEAMDIFRWYLHTNLRDGLGVRYRMLAIRMKMSFPGYVTFCKSDKSGDTVDDWFMNNYQNFPDEFKEWSKLYYKKQPAIGPRT